MYGITGFGVPPGESGNRGKAFHAKASGSSESYRVKTQTSSAEKLVKAMHPHLNSLDLSPSLTARLLTRMDAAVQENLAKVIDLILISWAQEHQRGTGGPLSRIYEKAHRMIQAGQPAPRIVDERDPDTQAWRRLAQGFRD